MSSFGCYQNDADGKRFFKAYSIVLLVLTVSVIAVNSYYYTNSGIPIKLAVIHVFLCVAMTGAHLTIYCRFVTLLMCTRNRFRNINEHMR